MNRKHLDNTRLLLPPNKHKGFKPPEKPAEDQLRAQEKRIQNRLSLFRDRRTAGEILPEERVCGCGKIPVNAPGMRIQVAGEKGKYFSGVMNCGSVWNCPVCAKKIGLHRAATVTGFLREFLNWKSVEKYSLGFLTLTVRHKKGEFLKDNLKKLLKGFREIEQSRRFRDEKKRVGYIGCIRTVEVKHGGNGWHPHFHLLLIGKCDDDVMEKFGSFFIQEWLNKNSDGVAEAQKYLPVKDEQGIADYITKWNAATEMTLGTEKKRNGSFTPFEMLEIYKRNSIERKSPEKWNIAIEFRELYKEYAEAMKGKKQLTISRDLIREYEKLSGKRFSMKTDEEINNEDQKDVKIVEIERDVFKLISSYNYQAEVLNSIEYDGIKSCVEMLNDRGIECEWDELKNIIQIPIVPVKLPEAKNTLSTAAWKTVSDWIK